MSIAKGRPVKRGFIDLGDLADLAGTSRRAIEKAARNALLHSGAWRGSRLAVREIAGRGGRAGISYEVSVASLPADLQERYRLQQLEPSAPIAVGREAQIERSWLLQIIRPALAHEKHSRARGAAIRDIVSREHVDPRGQIVLLGRRSLERWIDQYERHGLAGLGRRSRSDRGQKKVLISRRWDAGVPFSTEVKQHIADELLAIVRRAIADRGRAGALEVDLASHELCRLTVEAGFKPAQRVLEALCMVPLDWIKVEHRKYRRLYQLRNDRKRLEDNSPAVRRSGAPRPMDVVYGDVHPVDVQMMRDDGTTAHARLIAWADDATRRLHVDIVLAAGREGITNADVIQSFRRMVTNWGLPRVLYIDNGREYLFADFLEDAFALVSNEGQRMVVEDVSARSGVLRAKPHSGRSKKIEGIFRQLEQGVFSLIPGYVGGDRMAPKTPNVSRRVVPFHGSFELFCEYIGVAIRHYENQPQRGQLKGRSPIRAWNEALAAGWHKQPISDDALVLAFSTEETRAVRNGAIKIANEFWTCDELITSGLDRVAVRLPKYQTWSRLPILYPDGRLMGFATKDIARHPLDPEGARESGRRKKIALTATRRLGQDISPTSTLDRLIARDRTRPEELDIPSAPVVGLTPDHAEIAQGVREGTSDREARKRERELSQHRERLALEERFNQLLKKRSA